MTQVLVAVVVVVVLALLLFSPSSPPRSTWRCIVRETPHGGAASALTAKA